MKIILFSRLGAGQAAEQVRSLVASLDRLGFDYAVNEEFAPAVEEATGRPLAAARYGSSVGDTQGVAAMVCYGGDGTLLEGVRRLGAASLPVVGINAGHLGFLTGAPSAGAEALFARIAAGELDTEPRTMIEIEGDFGEERKVFALNEFAVQRNGAGLISVAIFVDGQLVATCPGDGVIVSTPTGSTAYSLSAGGPVVAPSCRCLLLAPLTPHNLTMRPVVIPDTSLVELRVRTRHAGVFVTADNRAFPAAEGASFRIRLSERRIFLAVAHNISFYDTLRNKMMWGVDPRN